MKRLLQAIIRLLPVGLGQPLTRIAILRLGLVRDPAVRA